MHPGGGDSFSVLVERNRCRYRRECIFLVWNVIEFFISFYFILFRFVLIQFIFCDSFFLFLQLGLNFSNAALINVIANTNVVNVVIVGCSKCSSFSACLSMGESVGNNFHGVLPKWLPDEGAGCISVWDVYASRVWTGHRRDVRETRDDRMVRPFAD